MISENVALAWSKDRQLAVVGHLITNYDFAVGDGTVIEPEWFGSETALVKTRILQKKFYQTFARMPSLAELIDGPDMQSESLDIKDLVARAVNEAVAASQRFGLDALVPEIRRWNKDLLYRSYVKRGWDLYSNAHPDDAYTLMEEMIAKLRDVDRGMDRRVDWTQFSEQLRRREEEYGDALTWGHPLFDSKLMPEADSGSLVRGQTTLLLSGTNRGKSRCLTTVVLSNFWKGKHILWLTHEDPEVDVIMNFWCALLRKTRGELLAYQRTPEGQEVMSKLAPLVNERVEFAFLPPTGLPVEDVVASIRRRHAAHVAKHGKGFDLCVDDYPKKLTSSKIHGDYRHVLTYIYGQFVGLALELGFHMIAAYQTNRTGHAAVLGGQRLCDKCKKHRVPDRFINEADAGEAFDPMQDVANVVSLNRDRAMELAGVTCYYFCKTKASQAKGWAVACRGRYDYALTHAEDYAATAFYADNATAAQCDEWLGKYAGIAVPEHEVVGAPG